HLVADRLHLRTAAETAAALRATGALRATRLCTTGLCTTGLCTTSLRTALVAALEPTPAATAALAAQRHHGAAKAVELLLFLRMLGQGSVDLLTIRVRDLRHLEATLATLTETLLRLLRRALAERYVTAGAVRRARRARAPIASAAATAAATSTAAEATA